MATPGIDLATKSHFQRMTNAEYAEQVFANGKREVERFARLHDMAGLAEVAGDSTVRAALQCANEGIAEATWFRLNRPFYNVYPVVLGMIDGVKLSLPFNQVRLPFDSMLFQFPVDACPQVEVGGADRRLCSVLWYSGPDYVAKENHERLYVCIMSFENDIVPHCFYLVDDNSQEVEAFLRTTMKSFAKAVEQDESRSGRKFDSGKAFEMGESAIDKPLLHTMDYQQAAEWCFRLLVLVSLLASGEDLITPVLLSKDQQESDLLGPAAAQEWVQRRAEKARQRGVFGFDVGRDLQKEKECSPHFRNPHLALFHVGPGRTEARVQLRRGAVVISKALTQVPTGFLGPETIEEREACERVVVREPISTRTRFFILKRDGYRCQICGADAKTDTSVQLHIDHKTAVAKGGSSDISNLWVLCSRCNLGKGTSDL
jgi:hypothetical protein